MENPAVILCPMECECALLVSRLEGRRETALGGYVFYEGIIDGCPTVVVRCLIGTVNAAVCTLAAIERYHPRCVIVQGTAGAHDPDLVKGDVIIADRVVALMNVRSSTRGAGEGSDPFGWEDFGVQYYSRTADRIDFANEFSCDGALVALARSVPYAEGRLFVGAVGCADMWNKEIDLIDHYRRAKGTLCEAMEGVAAAQVCASFGVPMTEIRVISNNEWHAGDHYDTDAAQSSQRFVCDLLARLA